MSCREGGGGGSGGGGPMAVQECKLWLCRCRIDPYGFERPHDYESYKEMMSEYVSVLNRRSLRWSKLLQETPHMEKNLTGDGVLSMADPHVSLHWD